MNRPRNDPPVKFQTYIPKSLALRVDILLHDPIYSRTKYGSRSSLVEQLLRQWIQDVSMLAAKHTSITEEPTNA